MFIKKITIKNFKCFEKETIELAIPSNDNNGLNIFVGENNSGKSTVFDALLKFALDKSILEEEKRNKNNQFCVEVTDSKDETKRVTGISAFGSQLKVEGGSTFSGDILEFISSRRNWNSHFSTGSMTFLSYLNNQTKANKNAADGQLGYVLAEIEKDKKNEFTEYMQKFISNFHDWTIAEDRHGKFVRYLVNNNSFHEADLLSDGTVSLFRIVAHIVNTDSSKILLFDEPELSLHPQAQKQLFQIIKKLAETRQVLVSTHSLYFIDPDIIENIVCFQNDNIKGVTTSKLSEPQKAKNLLHLENRELFFAKNIVLVEGYQDRIRFRKFLSRHNIKDFFVISGLKYKGVSQKICEDLKISFKTIVDLDYLVGKFPPDLTAEEIKRITEYEELEKVLPLAKMQSEILEKFLREKVQPKILSTANLCPSSKMRKKIEMDFNYENKIKEEIIKLKSKNTFVLYYGSLENYLDEDGYVVGNDVEEKKRTKNYFWDFIKKCLLFRGRFTPSRHWRSVSQP